MNNKKAGITAPTAARKFKRTLVEKEEQPPSGGCSSVI
jgi:hypothetical protein